jgi:phosphoribosyl-AMP cyclohydrolase
MKLTERLSFSDRGLVPAIIANVEDKMPLTLCYMNREALEKTLETGRVYVFRRSKGRVMLKGETSGHIQEVKDVRIDCAGNSLLIFVKQRVAGCHKGYMSCYFERYDADKDAFTITAERVFDPDRVY